MQDRRARLFDGRPIAVPDRLEEAAKGYNHFKEEQDTSTKVVLKPGMAAA